MQIAKILANKEQLDSIGIESNITGLYGKVINYFNTGYIEIEITHNVGKFTFTNNFDIPKKWLEINE